MEGFRIKSTGVTVNNNGRVGKAVLEPPKLDSADAAFIELQKRTFLYMCSPQNRVPNYMRQFFTEEDLLFLDNAMERRREGNQIEADMIHQLHSYDVEERDNLRQDVEDLENDIKEYEEHGCDCNRERRV